MGVQISMQISGCSSDRFVRISGLVNYSVDNINDDTDESEIFVFEIKKFSFERILERFGANKFQNQRKIELSNPRSRKVVQKGLILFTKFRNGS